MFDTSLFGGDRCLGSLLFIACHGAIMHDKSVRILERQGDLILSEPGALSSWVRHSRNAGKSVELSIVECRRETTPRHDLRQPLVAIASIKVCMLMYRHLSASCIRSKYQLK